MALLGVLVWSRTSSRAGLPCCPLRGTGQDSPCTGRAAPGPWAGDGLCEPRQGAELGTGSRCWQEQPHTAEARARRDRELLPQMLGRGTWAPPCCPCGSHTFPQQLSPGSFPSLSRAPVLIPRGLGCALPCSSQSPGKEGQAPGFHRSLCVSSPGRSTVAFHCHPLLPVLSLFPPLGFLGQCKGLGVAGACPGRDPLDPAVEVCLGEQSAQVLSGAVQLIPWVSCRAAGCPPEGHSSPIVSLGCLGYPRSRHLRDRKSVV